MGATVDIHHQGLKKEHGTGDDVPLSLGIPLAPGGPTLTGLEGGACDRLTRQMHVHVYDELSKHATSTWTATRWAAARRSASGAVSSPRRCSAWTTTG